MPLSIPYYVFPFKPLLIGFKFLRDYANAKGYIVSEVITDKGK